MKNYFFSTLRLFCFLMVCGISSALAQPWTIWVYAGPGTDKNLAQSTIQGLEPVLDENYRFEIVGLEQINNEPCSENVAAVIFPGGSSATDCLNALGVQGRTCIVNYAQAGGCVIGFCTGAYALSRVRCFVGVQGQIGPCELPEGQYLFPGSAYGPALAAYDMENRGISATAAAVRWAGDPAVTRLAEGEFDQYWNGGAVFVPDDPMAAQHGGDTQNSFPEIHYAQPLYEALPDNVRNLERPVAATMGACGNGHYACFGIHPEYNLRTFAWNGQWNADRGAGWWQTIRALPNSLNLLLNIRPSSSQYILSVFLARMGLGLRATNNLEPGRDSY